MLKAKKGFTLVELLAVIVILAIILAIAVPSITGMINNTRKSAFESDVRLIITGIEYRQLQSGVDPTIPEPKAHEVGTGTTAELADYGADPANYTAFEITNMSPITINLTSSSDSEFGAWTTTGATKSSITITAVP
ncbi:MAG: prepilin-type N-terminal cleavage/methylation domain-containing protein [Bacilli bacterium]|nr:prepilin-type N-terminal cleavage/methylation domain-containing protein [Bacilli bacterium]